MKIVTLVEDTTQGRLPSEHGLSLYIETHRHKILYDAGLTNLFAENAEALGVDLSLVDCAFLSHGHHDHSGGFLRFLEINDRAPIYMSAYALEPHFNGKGKSIGVDGALADSSRIKLISEDIVIDEELSLFVCSDAYYDYPMAAKGMTVERDGIRERDDFCHEVYLQITENGKRIVLSSCSHRGIRNIAQWFDPDVLIGGFHVSKVPCEELALWAEELDRHNTDYYTCHCTGVEQYEYLAKQMRSLGYISTGMVLEI